RSGHSISHATLHCEEGGLTASRSHPLHDIDSQKAQSSLESRGGQAAERETAIAALIRLGLQDRASLKETAECVGEVEEVVGQDIGLVLGIGELEHLWKPQQAHAQGPLGWVSQVDWRAREADGLGLESALAKDALDAGIRVLKVSGRVAV